MKIFDYLTLIACAIVLNSCSSSKARDYTENESITAPNYINSEWAMDRLWEDGLAEVATYQAERIIYNKVRQFDYTYVLVKEEFNKQYQVKTDNYQRGDLYSVMKVNKFCRIPTDNYPYHFLTSAFFKRSQPYLLHKLTNTSQEWCGNTAKSFLEKGKSYDFDYISYWDGQGNGSTSVKTGPWFEDQLSYTLRSLQFEDGLAFDKDIYPSQISSKASTPSAYTAKFKVSKAKDILPEYSQGWQVSMTTTTKSIDFWFSADYPNYLLKMEASDGRKLVLKDLKRDDYWVRKPQ
ncbi:MAG: hypothetical protein KI790_03380 [Cyclobacteriaceae bacterium]|nr:hypothetical protein [Cyclobacteriaceae bacterium HetDA_MAG_MS6]